MRATKFASSGAGLPRILVLAEGEVVDPLEEEREAVGRGHRREEGIHARLERLVLQQA